jgi:hypothetical protein
MYTESYHSETECLKLRIKFFSQFISFQKSIEIEENANIQMF